MPFIQKNLFLKYLSSHFLKIQYGEGGGFEDFNNFPGWKILEILIAMGGGIYSRPKSIYNIS